MPHRAWERGVGGRRAPVEASTGATCSARTAGQDLLTRPREDPCYRPRRRSLRPPAVPLSMERVLLGHSCFVLVPPAASWPRLQRPQPLWPLLLANVAGFYTGIIAAAVVEQRYKVRAAAAAAAAGSDCAEPWRPPCQERWWL